MSNSNPTEFPVVVHIGANGQKYKYVDITGGKFGQWTVLRRVHNAVFGKTTHSAWLCVCTCGKRRTMFARLLTTGQSTRCLGCYGRAQRKSAHSQVWGQINAHARDRDLEVGVTEDEIFALLEEQQYLCALTGLPIKIADSKRGHNVGRETTASLDRIDSARGYVRGNVWWVHKQVNIMKHKLSVARFVELCRRVSAKFPLGAVNESA